MDYYRQGDILLIKQDVQPKKEGYKFNSQPVILGLGEATGHKHQIKSGAQFYTHKDTDLTTFAIIGVTEEPIFINVESPTEIEHEEHAPIKIDEGYYEVIRQREYSPERIHYVQD